MINKSFDAVDKADIEALVTNQVPEGRTLEYKEVLPGGSDGERKEFLADISAFANAAGGDVLYGIAEKRDANNKPTGLPESANGLSIANADTEIRRLDSMILNGIDPRIAGVRIRAIDGFSAGPIIIVRIPKSWAAPHMVAINESRFYSRNNAGKYPLDVTEIRSAFILSKELPERIARFRADRLARIVADETPVPLPNSAKVVLHVIPVTAFTSINQVNFKPIENDAARLAPIHSHGWEKRYNLDGFITYQVFRGSSSPSYLQVFRNGIIEAVEAEMLDQPIDGHMYIPSQLFEFEIIQALQRYLQLEKLLGVESPILIMLSVLGVKGYIMATKRHYRVFGPRQIDRDTLLLPEVMVEDYSTLPDVMLHPIFDAMWQAAGWPASENYNSEGIWAES